MAFGETADAVALIAWLHRDLLIKRLDAEIDVEDGDAGALSHEAREKAEAEVMGDLLAVEREEAAFVFAAWEETVLLASIAATSARSRCLVCGWSPHSAQRNARNIGGILMAVAAMMKTETRVLPASCQLGADRCAARGQ